MLLIGKVLPIGQMFLIGNRMLIGKILPIGKMRLISGS
jgi:hypothetical protein